MTAAANRSGQVRPPAMIRRGVISSVIGNGLTELRRRGTP
jgi:hypothetical protein